MALRPAVKFGWLGRASVVAASVLVLAGMEAGVMAGLERPLTIVQAQTVEELRNQASQLNNDGQRLKLQGDWRTALDKYEQALTIVQEIEERQGEGVIINNIGEIYQRLGQYDKALGFFQQSLTIRLEVGDRWGEGVSLSNIGSLYKSLGQYEKALNYYQQSLTIRKEVEDRKGEGVARNNIGSVYYSLGQYKKALGFYQQSLAIRQEVSDRQGEGFSLNNIGSVYYSLGQYNKALELYQQSLAVRKEVGDRKGEGDSLSSIGSIYSETGRYERALEFYQQSLAIQQEISDSSGESTSLNNIGGIYDSLGQYEKALNYYQQSLAINQELGDRSGEGNSLNNIGAVYSNWGQHDRALESYQQSLALQEEIGDRSGKGNSLNNIGALYHRLGQYEKALELHQQSLVIKQEIGDLSGEGISLNNIGSIYDSLGQYDKALNYYQQFLAINQDIGNHEGEGDALNNIGGAYTSLGQYERALGLHQQSLAIRQELGDRQGEGKSLNNIGGIYSSLNQYDKALNYYQQSLAIKQEIGDRSGEGKSLNNIGLIYDSLGQYNKALNYYWQSLAIDQETSERESVGATLNNIAHTFNAQNHPQLATLFFKKSVSTYETIRADIRQLPIEQQKSYTKTVEHTYRELADLLLQQDRILEAQQVLDLLKVQELEDYLHNTRSSDSSDLIILKPEQEILDRYQELQNTAIEIGKELTELRQRKTKQGLTTSEETRLTELLALETDINSQFNAFIESGPIQGLLDQLSRKTLAQTVDLTELNALRDNLRKTNAALIYPLILEDRLELILTTPDSPPIRRTVTNFDAPKLKETIVAYRSALQSPNDLEGTQQLAQQLHDWLIAPLEADLAAANPDTLIYAPDGVLRYIPLAALHDGEQWLAQRYATNNIVAKSLTEFDTAPATQPKVLAAAWGNQSHSITAGDKTFNFSGIPFTTTEVQSLAQLLPTEALLEQDFSRDNLTAKDLNSFNIIHLATHGKFVTGNANHSFLALGSGEAIPLPDIKNLSLTDVDLVVLSACETGVGGDFGQGEEILGLGYQFQRAGAKAALASLWQVDDGGTQLLMNAFYAALDQGMTKAAALQAAQQALISSNYQAVGLKRAGIEVVSPRTGKAITDSQLSHPYYWAPFILIGNGL